MRFSRSHLPGRRRRLASALLALLALGVGAGFFSALEAQVRRSSLWNDPVFQKQLVGSFGINAEIEPGLTVGEQEYFDQIAPMIGSDPDRAKAFLQKLVEIEDSSALFDFTLGNLYFQEDRRREAIAHMEKAVGKFPSFLRAHKNLAILYVQEQQPREAIRHFTKAIELGASDGTTYGLLGTAYVGTEEFVAAEGAFRNALLLNPEVNDWKLGLARALLAQEKFAEVVSLLNAMIAKKPDDMRLWMLQADAYIGNKEVLQAAANFEIAKSFGEIEADSLTTLGHIYVNEGLLDLAVEAYLEAFEKDPAADIEGTLQAAKILVEREGLEQAERLIAEVKKIAGEKLNEGTNRLEVLRMEAKIGMARGNGASAAEILETVVGLDPLDGESLIMLGQHYGEIGEKERAYFKYERAAGIEGFEADAKVRHGQLLVGEGKYREAVPLLRQAQEIKPRENVGRFLEELERYTRARS